MKIPCNNKVTCCPGVPLTNYSSEAPDQFIYFSAFFIGAGQPSFVPPFGGVTRIPGGCSQFGSSAVSQEEADLCSGRQATLCEAGQPAEECPSEDVNPDPPVPPADDPPAEPMYRNSPQTCIKLCPDGSTNEFTVPAGAFVAVSQELADRMAFSYACRQARVHRICITNFDGFTCADPDQIGSVSNTILTAFSPSPIVKWELVSGTLPPDVTLSSSGLLSGRTTLPGFYSFTVKATAADGHFATKEMTWNVLGFVTDASLPNATVGSAYSKQLISDGGGISYVITAGSLPAGLSMDADGLISGTASAAVTDQEFTVTVSDSSLHTCSQQFLISVITACVADTCGTPASPPTAFSPVSAFIPDWNTVKLAMVAPTADPAGAQPEWDGTFPVLDLITIPGFLFYEPAGSVPPGGFVALAFNGYLGDTAGIVILGGGQWTLTFQGFVGGVSTTIWQGIKTVGVSPQGTYMRDTGGTPGIATGPDCFVVESLACEPLAWWAFEDDANNPVDSECGLVLSDLSHNIFLHSLVAGKVGTALRLSASGFNDVFNTCTDTSLLFTRGGFTMTCWIRVTDVIFDADNRAEVIYRFTVGGVNQFVKFQRAGAGTTWEAVAPGAAPISIAMAAGFHFFVLTYDAVNGILGFDMDNAGITTTPCTPLTPDPGSSVLTMVSADTALSGLGSEQVDFDEFAVFDGILTAAQLTVLYNGGAGTAYPP